MKKIIIVLISAANSYAMEPKIDSSRILCTHDSIHRDLLIQHTVKCGLEPEESKKWQIWEDVPKTIQKSICNYYYDTQYQLYKNGCQKKGWTKGSISSLLKFIGTPFDANTPYNNVPTIEKVRSLMPQICLLKKMASVIPFEVQQTHIKELLDGTKYMQQYHLSKITAQLLLPSQKNNSVSSLTCNNHYVFAGFNDGTITIWDASQIYQPIIKRSYKAHRNIVQSLLSLQKYLVSSANHIKIWDQETGQLYYTLTENLRFLGSPHVNHLCAFDNNHFVSATKDGTLSVWNVTTGTKTYTHSLALLDIHTLSYSKNYIIVTGAASIHGNTTLFFKKEIPTIVNQVYTNNRWENINQLIYSDPNSFIIAENNRILFFDHQSHKIMNTLQIDSCNTNPITDLMLFKSIGLYSADNEIKTFNLVNDQKGKTILIITSSLQCNSKPTKIAQFQEDFFLSGHSNGDVFMWVPHNYFEIIYGESSIPEIALLQFAYQQPNTKRLT